MRIALIGMSNIGKTYWSKKLEGEGFKRYCCDDMIEEDLKEELKAAGYSGIDGVAEWMGQPYSPQYPLTSKKYLGFENNSIKTIVDKLQDAHENVVVDTTGSVIYTDLHLQNLLKDMTVIIHLDTVSELVDKMYKKYIAEPKPVIWGDSFRPRNGENHKKALARCYPELLHYRLKKYNDIAHLTIPYSFHHNQDLTTSNFINYIGNNLSS